MINFKQIQKDFFITFLAVFLGTFAEFLGATNHVNWIFWPIKHLNNILLGQLYLITDSFVIKEFFYGKSDLSVLSWQIVLYVSVLFW